MTAWRNLPPALPPHGTVLAWARGCRCEECEREYQRFVSELAWRGPLRLAAQPEPRKLDADTRARLEPAVSQSECPVCGAQRHQSAATWRSPSISRRLIRSAEAARDRGSKDLPKPSDMRRVDQGFVRDGGDERRADRIGFTPGADRKRAQHRRVGAEDNALEMRWNDIAWHQREPDSCQRIVQRGRTLLGSYRDPLVADFALDWALAPVPRVLG